MLSGTKDNTSNPLNGTSFAQRNADGTWADPVPTGLANGATSGSAITAIAGPDNQTPIYVFDYGGNLWLQVGATGRTSGTEVHLGDTQLGGSVEGNGPRFGHDAAGRYWLTWYNSTQPARGLPAAVRPDHRAADRQRRSRAEVDRSAELRRRPYGAGMRRASAASSTTRPTRRATTRPTWTRGAPATPTRRRVSGPLQPNVSIAASAVPERRHVDRLARGRHPGLPRRARQRERRRRRQPQHRAADEAPACRC